MPSAATRRCCGRWRDGPTTSDTLQWNCDAMWTICARARVQTEAIGYGEVARLHGTPPANGENKKPRRNATGDNRWSADSSVGSANCCSDHD
jgi:hypothetical protein